MFQEYFTSIGQIRRMSYKILIYTAWSHRYSTSLEKLAFKQLRHWFTRRVLYKKLQSSKWNKNWHIKMYLCVRKTGKRWSNNVMYLFMYVFTCHGMGSSYDVSKLGILLHSKTSHVSFVLGGTTTKSL